MTLTYEDFNSHYRKTIGGFQCATSAALTPDGRKVEIVKVDEDPDHGYGYAIIVDGKEVCWRYFDGFGCLDRPNDVLHTINEIL